MAIEVVSNGPSLAGATPAAQKTEETKSELVAEKAAEQTESTESETGETEEVDESEGESESDEDKEESKESEKEQSKRKTGSQRRKERAERAEAENERLRSIIEELARKSAGDSKPAKEDEVKPAAADDKPKADDFDSYTEFAEALADWKVEQKLKEREQKAEKSRLESEQAKAEKAHSERMKSFAEKTEDFEEVLENLRGVPYSASVDSLIRSSENGPELVYELAKNPEEATRLAGLNPLAAARELGKIEAKILARTSEEKKPELKKITSAPKPINPVGGGRGAVQKDLNTPNLSQQEYEAIRRKQIAARGKSW